MLTNGRITCFNSVSRPTRSRRLFSLRGSFVSYVERLISVYNKLKSSDMASLSPGTIKGRGLHQISQTVVLEKLLKLGTAAKPTHGELHWSANKNMSLLQLHPESFIDPPPVIRTFKG